MPTPRRDAAQAARERAIRAKWQHVRFRDNRHPATREDRPRTPLPPRCWCGGPNRHGWPGKQDGVPHPQ